MNSDVPTCPVCGIGARVDEWMEFDPRDPEVRGMVADPSQGAMVRVPTRFSNPPDHDPQHWATSPLGVPPETPTRDDAL